MYEEYGLPSHFQWSGKPLSAHGAGQQGLSLVHWPSQPDKMLQYLYRSTDWGAQALSLFGTSPANMAKYRVFQKFVPIVNCILRKAFNTSLGKCKLIQVRNLSKKPLKAISN